MKFSAVIVAAAAAVMCLVQPTAAEAEGVHLRVHVDKGICYLQCPSGQYCANGTNQCRGANNGECFNPATGAFQSGCAPGFKCDNGKEYYA
ncbi:hypothetical protein PHYBOEH_009892 [Phytophthora boehmeriae]|uniref:Uncharacterized protein n=1 Tax=Phytophthora boehmeriae TaxID=109152 RepID=A0A8T1VQ09_9STRA|nr:hypothetical protein PHYBOEH_009892 [Phytophthora boehmeriae]